MKTILFLISITVLLNNCDAQIKDSSKMQKKPIEQVLKDNQNMLLSIPGVQGFYQSKLDNGEDYFVIMVDSLTENNKYKLPKTLDGYIVTVEEVGQIKPLNQEKKKPLPDE
jgi:hypothetical protein